MTAIENLLGLPGEIDELAASAGSEGLALVTRLVKDYRSGKNCFDHLGEEPPATWEPPGTCGRGAGVPAPDPQETQDSAGRLEFADVVPVFRHPIRKFAGGQRVSRASIRAGITLCTSPTIPRSATEKIGASGSLLMAIMVDESFMPTKCCIAPLMPHAM